MRCRIRRIFGDGRLIGGFAEDGDGKVEAVLLTDYFFEVPRLRRWKEPASLATAGADDLEVEVASAHRSVTVSEEIIDAEIALVPDVIPDLSDAVWRYRSVRAWLAAEMGLAA